MTDIAISAYNEELQNKRNTKIPLTTMPSSCAKTSSSMAQQGKSSKVKMSQQGKVILKFGYHVVRCYQVFMKDLSLVLGVLFGSVFFP